MPTQSQARIKFPYFEKTCSRPDRIYTYPASHLPSLQPTDCAPDGGGQTV